MAWRGGDSEHIRGAMASTIFERTGGFAVVRKIISDFYNRILDDPSLQKYFDGIDMPRLIDHQTQFISAMMGGPGDISNDALMKAHARLGVSKADFKTLAAILGETLEDHGLPDDSVEHVIQEVMAREAFIVTKR